MPPKARVSPFWAVVFWLIGKGAPLECWPGQFVDVSSPTVRRLIARALRNERRERASHIAWTYSRDRIVERRELALESAEQKAARLARAYKDRFPLRWTA
jgi:hypothetical protein